MTTDNRPLRDRAQPAATWVGTDRRTATTPPTLPAGPAPGAPRWVDTGATELTAEQKIRADALHEAVSAGFQLDDGHDDRIGAILTVAARFEAYMRDGAA